MSNARPTRTLPAAASAHTRHLDALRPHPDEPREVIRESDPQIQALADSIIQYGVLEPLVVNADNVIYAGHRRKVASRVAYLKTGDKKFLWVPVVVNDTPTEEALELMLQENMQRASLTPLEEARSMAHVMRRRQLTVAGLSRVVKLPPDEISKRLAVLRLEPAVQALYHANELPLSVAPLLARVSTPGKQASYAGLLARRQLNVTQFRKAVEGELAPLAPDADPTLGEPLGPTAPLARAPGRPRAGYVKRRAAPDPAAGVRQHPTRAEAVAALNRSPKRQVSMVTVKGVLDSICCSCGMQGQVEVCRLCPLPRLVLGLVGRTGDAPKNGGGRAGEGEDGRDE